MINILIHTISSSSSLSLRSTAMIILSFLSQKPSFQQLIHQHGWKCQQYNGNTICLPINSVNSIFSHIIEKNDTIASCNHFSTDIANCSSQLPLDSSLFSNLLRSQNNYHISSSSLMCTCPSDIQLKEPLRLSEIEQSIIHDILNLSSFVYCKESKQHLSSLKEEHPEYFQNISRTFLLL